jgi:hypothetical protein
MRLSILASISICAACGGGGGGGDDTKQPDASNVPATITIAGVVSGRDTTTTKPLSGIVVTAYKASDDSLVAMATSDASGNYSITVTTNGAALDGYLKATNAGYLDTYLYPPAPVSADFSGASVNMITTNTFSLVANTLCGGNQMTSMGAMAVEVIDSAMAVVPGAMVSSTPAAGKVCYNMGGFPNKNATMTDTDGIAYLLNVTGSVSVTATKAGSTFTAHSVNARAGAFTTTLIQP